MGPGKTGGPGARAREDTLLREVRALLFRSPDRSERMRRLDRMERVARVWVNGRPLGPRPSNSHLYETYD
jgi:hypothetical protein